MHKEAPLYIFLTRLWGISLGLLHGCSPLHTSLHDERHQWELTVHEVQTNLDDLRHDVHCFQMELQIVDSRMKALEGSLSAMKQQDLEKHQTKIDQIFQQLHQLQQKWGSLETVRDERKEELTKLSAYANETHLALSQFKRHIEELEKEVLAQNRRLEAIAKGGVESLPKSLRGTSYTVKSGDSLEKIARTHHTTVEQIKKLNHLAQDRIITGQELLLPYESE
jgi:LysM repeat protein